MFLSTYASCPEGTWSKKTASLHGAAIVDALLFQVGLGLGQSRLDVEHRAPQTWIGLQQSRDKGPAPTADIDDAEQPRAAISICDRVPPGFRVELHGGVEQC